MGCRVCIYFPRVMFLSTDVFQAEQLIFLVVQGIVHKSIASCMAVCKSDIVENFPVFFRQMDI